MIKIQEHLNRADAERFLDELAGELWDYLNPKLKGKKDLKKSSVIEKCKYYKSLTRRKTYTLKYANGETDKLRRQKSFFTFLLEKDARQLKRIVTSRPNQYASIISDVFNIINRNDLYDQVGSEIKQTAFGVLLSEKIFNYKAFRASVYCKDLFTKIGVSSASCPYCNDNQLKIVDVRKNSSEETKKKAYLDLDHFYPKSQNPFLAVSFFNLIPSCHDCNSRDKGDKPFTIESHIHPYFESFDDIYKFKISLTALLGDPIDEIKIEKKNVKPLDHTLRDLQLEARYSTHLIEAQSLVKFFYDYNKRHIGTSNEDSFLDAIFSLKGVPKCRTDILKNPRGKFHRDILKQIDIKNLLGLT